MFTLPNDDELYAGECMIWVDDEQCTKWAVRARFHFTKACDTVGQLAALVTKAVKAIITQERALLNGRTLGSVTVLFSNRYNVKVNVKSISYNLNGSVHITVHVLDGSNAETLNKTALSWMSLSQSIPTSPSQVRYWPQHSATRYVLPNRPLRTDWFVAPSQAGRGFVPTGPPGTGIHRRTVMRPVTTGSDDEPLFVRPISFLTSTIIVWTAHPHAKRWAMVGPFDFVSTTGPANIRLAADLACRYVMSALARGIGHHYTGIRATRAESVSSVTVTFPEGNASGIEEVQYHLRASAEATEDEEVIEVFMVPLCHCMRQRTADDLLDELEKTPCVHSLTAALHEFAARRLHLASSIEDGLSAIPNGFALPHHEVQVIEHCIQVNPRLTTWCAEPDCPFLWRDDSHPQLDSA